MNDLVSIIIPIYNAAVALPRCLNSLLQQTYRNLEIILVNDGSTDQSEIICNQFSERDNRIKVIKQKNAGPSTARNKGIDAATGKYLQFVDADDFLESDMTETMVSNIKEAELVICGYHAHSTENHLKQNKVIPPLTGMYRQKDFLKHFSELYQAIIIPSIWNKLYDREIVMTNQICFKEDIRMGEDLLFNLDYLKRCHTICLIPDLLYHYVMGENTSLSRAYNKNYIQTQERLYQETKAFLIDQASDTPANMNLLSSIYAMSVINGLNNLFHPNSELTEHEQKQRISQIIMKNPVIETLPYFKGSKQLSLMRHLLKANAVNRIFLFFKIKNKIQHKSPMLFRLIKRFN